MHCRRHNSNSLGPVLPSGCSADMLPLHLLLCIHHFQLPNLKYMRTCLRGVVSRHRMNE